MTPPPDSPQNETSPAEVVHDAPPFGANEMRLDARQWLIVLVLFLIFVFGAPRLWKHIERFDTGNDYRIPYALSSDYWLYQRRMEGIGAATIPVLGDSVVWGEYVRPDGTLTHFLNQERGHSGQFVNGGVNGLFPLSMEGLITDYAGSLHDRKVILHCNVLWMSSPQADLSTDKEQTFNHTLLVPQFLPRIPAYHGDATTRLGAVAERHNALSGWVHHLDDVYFNQKSIPQWTLEEDDSDPPRARNAWKNPLAQITLQVPGEPQDDPQRGPSSPRHKPWNANGNTPTHFEWVPLENSLQWRAFQRTVDLLHARGNNVLVVLGPFNESMVAEDQRPLLHQLQQGIADWLTAHKVAHIVPDVLPGELYADASHPLTEGYHLLAQRLCQNLEFKQWLGAQAGQP